jgi:hypothetical protein
MADASILIPIGVIAGAALVILGPIFAILHFRFRSKRRAQMAEFAQLRAGAR